MTRFAPGDSAAGSSRSDGVRRSGAPRWRFRLYVAGQSPKSMTALRNVQQLCDEYLAGDYDIELVDLVAHPARAQQDQILAVPTLVRYAPQPVQRIIGDLSDYERTLTNLNLDSIRRSE